MPAIRTETADALTTEELVRLYAAVGWSAYTEDPGTLRRSVSGSHRVVTARAEDGALLGLARSISDGATIVYLQDVLVDPRAQGRGLGRALLTELFGAYAGIRQQVLLTDAEPGQRAFYEALGFTETHEHDPALRAFVRLAG